jgi:hypothetical protein
MEKPFLFSPGWGTPIVAGEQVVEPQQQRKSDFELCRDLGRRRGQIWPDSVEDVLDEWSPVFGCGRLQRNFTTGLCEDSIYSDDGSGGVVSICVRT